MNTEQFENRKKTIDALIHDELYVPMKIKEIAILLNIPKEDRADLAAVLDALVAEGRVVVSKKGKYQKSENMHLLGVLSCTSKGFGFVSVEGMEKDIYVSEKDMNGAFDGDTVKIAITKRAVEGKRDEAKVISIVERSNKAVVGFFQKSKNFGFVLPDNQRLGRDIFIPEGKSMGAVDGHKVVVRITDYGSRDKNPTGEVTEIIGHINDPGVDILSIVRGYGIPEEFPVNVMDSLYDIPDSVRPKQMAGRMDIRDWQTVTIDGEDAKDLDDAITLTRTENGYRLGVHIADVSEYVKENSPLDREALNRGTSVYLVDRVIPMLPHKLSNGICSLNQGEDRLALSCIMDIDGKGNIVGHKIAETVIRVDRRMSYTNVKKIIVDRDEAVTREYADFVELFWLMKEVADLLREKRKQRGSIDFDFPETKVTLDADGKPVDIRPYEITAANKIIEDFMLAANETVAEDYFWQELPFVYRSHDNPDTDKMQALAAFINNFGFSIRVSNDEVHPKEIQKLLAKIQDCPEENLISRIALRSMKRASYTTECIGHFGLAAKYYCHFTSPIRRYPDLQIHRIIKENLHGGLKEKRIEHYHELLGEVARQSSTTERRAADAERDTVKLKMVQFMEDKIGNTYTGIVSGITEWGMYVELPNTIEGMVPLMSIRDGYYIYDRQHFELVNETTKRTFKLGQTVDIVVDSVDKVLRTIDFRLV